MATWPASLPQALHIGATEQRQKAFIRSEMETGPHKQRRRFTAASRFIRGSLLLTKAQRATFDTFYETTLGEGADEFDWVDPNDNSTTVSMRFTAVPQKQAVNGGATGVSLWRLGLELEILP